MVLHDEHEVGRFFDNFSLLVTASNFYFFRGNMSISISSIRSSSFSRVWERLGGYAALDRIPKAMTTVSKVSAPTGPDAVAFNSDLTPKTSALQDQSTVIEKAT